MADGHTEAPKQGGKASRGSERVTDADRDMAHGLVYNYGPAIAEVGEYGRLTRAIAAALAEERAKARAPFHDLAQELATVATDHHATVAGDAYADAADRIIAVLEGTYL